MAVGRNNLAAMDCSHPLLAVAALVAVIPALESVETFGIEQLMSARTHERLSMNR